MVISNRLLALLFSILVFAGGELASASLTEDFPKGQVATPAEMNALAVKIREEISNFSSKPSKESLQRLKRNLDEFRLMIAYVARSVSREEGGALTKTAREAKDTIVDLGIDIANALFVVRTEKAEVIAKSGTEQDMEDIMVEKLEYPLLQLAFEIAYHDVDERSNVDGLVTVGDVFRRTFFEIGRDSISLFKFAKNRSTGEWYYGPWEAYQREKAARAIIEKYRVYSKAHIPEFNRLYDGDLEYERENHEERLGGLLLWLTDRAVNIRVERDSAQRYARLSYLVTGALLALPMQLNVVGNSYSSHLESAILIFSSFASLYVLKAAASSTLSTRAWLDFNKEVRSEMADGLVKSTEIYLKSKFPREYHPAQVPSWIARRARIHKVIDEMIEDAKSKCNHILKRSVFKGSS